MMSSSWIAALAGAAVLATSLPALAQVIRFDRPVMNAAASPLTEVQFRGDGVRRFHGGGFGNRGFGHHGGGYHRGGRGVGIGAGIAGLAAGALIGGAIASQSGPAYGYGGGYGGGYGDPGYAADPGYAVDPGYAYAAPPAQVGDASAYCAQRFKSYDPGSGTYLGYDGQRHPCP